MYKKSHQDKVFYSRSKSMKSLAFAKLQLELFGERALETLKHVNSSADLDKLAASIVESKQTLARKETAEDSDHLLSYLWDSTPKKAQDQSGKAKPEENV